MDSSMANFFGGHFQFPGSLPKIATRATKLNLSLNPQIWKKKNHRKRNFYVASNFHTSCIEMQILAWRLATEVPNFEIAAARAYTCILTKFARNLSPPFRRLVVLPPCASRVVQSLNSKEKPCGIENMSKAQGIIFNARKVAILASETIASLCLLR